MNRTFGAFHLVVGIAGALALGGCGTDPNVFHVGCQQITRIDVGPGLTPSIGWSPGCRVATLGVYEAESVPPAAPGEDPVPPLPGGPAEIPGFRQGNLLWRITSPDVAGNLIEPSIRYGHAPGDVPEQLPPTALLSGQRYIVQLDSKSPDLVLNDLHWQALFQP